MPDTYSANPCTAEVIRHSVYQDGVDLDGCATYSDVLAAVERQSPESLDAQISGDDGNQPTLRERLESALEYPIDGE